MTIAVDPAAPRATIDTCKVLVSGKDFARGPNKTGGEFRYYIEAVRPSGSGSRKNLKSHVFDVSHEGDAEWLSVIFDEAGTWSLKLRDASNDSQVEAQSLVVS